MKVQTDVRGLRPAHCFRTGQALRATGDISSLLCSGRRQAISNRAPLLIECKESRIGKQLVTVPQGIEVTLKPGYIHAKNQTGELTREYNNELVGIEETEEKGTYRVSKLVESRFANMTHGLVRSLFDSMVVGLSSGFQKTLSLVGVGYRAAAGPDQLTLNLGYSNPVVMKIPKGITVQVERATTVHVKGFDKIEVGQFAANIRSKRPPEPYKGKGVRYVDEFVPKKEGKRGKK